MTVADDYRKAWVARQRAFQVVLDAEVMERRARVALAEAINEAADEGVDLDGIEIELWDRWLAGEFE